MSIALRTALLSSLLAAPAIAQTQDDLDLSLTAPRTEIGIDDCADHVQDEISLEGTLTGTYTDYELRLSYTFSESPCSRTSLETCPSSGGSGDQGCGCLKSSTSSPLRVTGKLSDLLDDQGDLCAQASGSRTRIRFYFEYFKEAETGDSDKEETSKAAELFIDFDRPDRPDEAPSVTSAENALKVDFAEVDGSDIDRYEVCVRPFEGTQEAEDAGVTSDAGTTTLTNEALREGFTSCKKTSSGVTEYRFEGLENGVPYMVVYAAIDTAGNRGPNSDPATGTPAQVDDFAEHYSKRGGQEEGGCQVGGGAADGLALGLVAALGIFGLRRRRNA